MHRALPASPPAYYDPPGSSTTYHATILVAVRVSDAIAGLLSPSCYDSIIMIKKLPYLPDILPSSSSAYNIYVEDFMVRDVLYLRLSTSSSCASPPWSPTPVGGASVGGKMK